MEKLNSNIGNTGDTDSSNRASLQEFNQAALDVKIQRETHGPGTDREAHSQAIIDSLTPDQQAAYFDLDKLYQDRELARKNNPFGDEQASIDRQIEALEKKLNQ